MARGFYVNFNTPEIKNVLGNLAKYDAKTALKIEDAVRNSTKAISQGAKQRVPVRTGNLKKSIRYSFNTYKCEGTVKAKEFYAHLAEFGAKAVPDRDIPERKENPYMRPAFENEKTSLIRNLTDAVKP